MTFVPYIPETAPFNSEQRAWLNGFLAGLFANGATHPTAPQSAAVPVADAGPLLVLFGSQTGSAEALARRVAKEAQQRGFAPKVLTLNEHQEANLVAGGKAVIITSTWGEGDPPDNAENFWSWLSADTAPRLDHLHFAVLGLGDRNYSDFCGASKKFDTRLEALGAKRLAPRAECDVDYEATAKNWIEGLWEKLDGKLGAIPHLSSSSSNESMNGSTHGYVNGSHVLNGPNGKTALGYGKANPFPARLLTNVLLNKDGSDKEVRHFELSLAGSGLSYEAGDALGVVPANCHELVDTLLGTLRCAGGELVKAGETSVPLREALTRRFDITKPSEELLVTVAKSAPASPMAFLVTPERRDELKKWLWGRDVHDVLALLSEPMPAEQLLPLLRLLAPRLYSISSSPKAHPDEVHLTVGAVRYECHGRARKGVASTFLADRVGDSDFVKVFVQASHGFKLPHDGHTPVIMVGPGTGIAPFRAFLEERASTGAPGKNWLFFGDQKRATDFLYEEELIAWQKSGLLTRLDLAFSRDQSEKIYVQHRMLENAAELWSWLEAGAHIYVCGDASRMAKDVDAALHQIVGHCGGKSADEAKGYVAKLKTERRYQRDVY